MALDPQLKLERLPQVLYDLLLENACLAFKSGKNWFSSDGLTLFRDKNTHVKNDGNVPKCRYSFLESMGIVVLGMDYIEPNCVRLAGGSVSLTSLNLQERTITKLVPIISTLGARDGIDRHTLEARWLSSNSSKLFPQPCLIIRRNDFLEFRMPFIARYTLGELMIQRRLNQDCSWLHISSALESLTRESKRHTSNEKKWGRSYIEIVQRRTSQLIQKSAISRFVHNAWDVGLVVNNTSCRPLKDILEIIKHTDNFGWLGQQSYEWCHGDFIPEDILSSENKPLQPIFVDPNPQNSSLIVDWGKMYMSLEICYDLLYRDWFSLKINEKCNIPTVSISYFDEASDVVNMSKTLAGKVLHTLDQNWVPVNVKDIGANGLEIQAGLQSAALPLFHSMHHKKHDRAIAFLALGMQQLELALR